MVSVQISLFGQSLPKAFISLFSHAFSIFLAYYLF